MKNAILLAIAMNAAIHQLILKKEIKLLKIYLKGIIMINIQDLRIF